MNRYFLYFVFLFLILFLLVGFACNNDDDDDDSFHLESDDDDADDDDLSQVDDDDASQDDDDNDSSSDDDDTVDPPSNCPGFILNETTEMIAGGALGLSGTSLCMDPSENIHVVAEKSLFVGLYSYSSQGVELRPVSIKGIDPEIACGPGGELYVAYVDTETSALMVATEPPACFQTIVVDDTATECAFPSIAQDAQGFLYIAYKADDQLRIATNQSGLWTFETLGDSMMGSASRIAIDPAGKVHLAHENNSFEIIYLTNETGSWIETEIDNGMNVPTDIGIVLDDQQKVHLNYYHPNVIYEWKGIPTFRFETELVYASNETGQWVRQIVTDQDDVGSDNQIAIDANGKVHMTSAAVLYYGFLEGLRYSTYESGTWTTNLLFPGATVDSSMIMDDSGYLHLSDMTAIPPKLMYRTNQSGSWKSETLDATLSGGQYPSLDLDDQGNAHVSYTESAELKLYYASNSSGFWEHEFVEEYNVATLPPSDVDLAADGVVHMVDFTQEYGGSNGPLNYWTRTSSGWSQERIVESEWFKPILNHDAGGSAWVAYAKVNGGTGLATNQTGAWVTETVPIPSYDSGPVGMNLDSGGNQHIVFVGYDPADIYYLGYATNKNGFWTVETVENSRVGSDVAFRLDSNDLPHISFFHYREGILRYASPVSGNWITEVVDGDTSIGNEPSMVIDEDGFAHIVYYGTDDEVRYATNESGVWQTTVLEVFDWGMEVDLEMDSQGDLHAVVFALDALWYIVFPQGGPV